ncbi:MAG: Histidine kinase [Gemmatimonadetes bacterium]|nr:Histidine kinase [Gemmatimonadota bacterium]
MSISHGLTPAGTPYLPASESETRLQLAIRAAHAGAWEWDIENQHVIWSPEIEAMHGIPEGSFDGTFESYTRDMYPGDVARVLATVAEELKAPDKHHLVYRIIRPDGELRWLEAYGQFICAADGRPLKLVGICTDVTEREREQDAQLLLAEAGQVLHASLDLGETLANVARLAVPRFADWCVVDLVGPGDTLERKAVAHVDPARVQLAHDLRRKYPEGALSALGPMDVVRTGQPKLVADISDTLLASATSTPDHFAMARELGLRAVIIVPLVARDGVFGTLSFVSAETGRRFVERDLTLAMDIGTRASVAIDNARLVRELREARADADRARAEAVEANRVKGEFLAMMSHELRTPLNAIGGYVQLLEMGIRGPVTEQQLTDLARVRRSQQHLLVVINDILNFAKLEAGRIDFHPAPTTVHALVDDAESLIRPQLERKSLEFGVIVPDPLPLVHVDEEKARQILLNLLSNAVKFTPEGGRIEVSASLHEGMVAVRVRDTGVGIRPRDVERIFEPFVQLERRLDQSGDGTGLGLAISRELARGMGGDLSATSIKGEGSTFLLTLPPAE